MVFDRALTAAELVVLFRETAASRRRGAEGRFFDIYFAQWLALLVAGAFGWWLYRRRSRQHR